MERVEHVAANIVKEGKQFGTQDFSKVNILKDRNPSVIILMRM